MLTVQEEVRKRHSVIVLEEDYEVFPESSRSPVTCKLIMSIFFFSPRLVIPCNAVHRSLICAQESLGKRPFLEEVGMKTGRKQLLQEFNLAYILSDLMTTSLSVCLLGFHVNKTCRSVTSCHLHLSGRQSRKTLRPCSHTAFKSASFPQIGS